MSCTTFLAPPSKQETHRTTLIAAYTAAYNRMCVSNDGAPMQDVSISELRAKCFALIRDVALTKKPLRITRHGKVVAEIVPPVPELEGRNFLGSGADTFDIIDDDIVGLIIDFTAD